MDSYDGALRVTVNIANELSKFYVVNFVSFIKSKSFYKIDDSIEVFYVNFDSRNLRKIIIKAIYKLYKFYMNRKVDIVISPSRLYLYFLYLANIFSNRKLIYHNHFSLEQRFIEEKTEKKKMRRIIYYLNYLVERNVDKIVVLTQGEMECYLRHGFSRDKLAVIHNWLDPILMTDYPKGNYSEISKSIITVGRIDYQKGYEYLIEVAEIVFSKHPEWIWEIYGDGNETYKNELLSKIREKGLEKNILFKGITKNIYDIYKDYSFLVMTSRFEGLPTVLLEAKANLLPLISFNCNTGPSDIIRDGIDGYLIEPFDVNDMAQKICFLIEHSDVRRKFSNNARGNLGKFSKDTILKCWQGLIESL